MAVKKKKKAKKRVRRFAIGGGTTTGTTITKDNNSPAGTGQGGQNSGVGAGPGAAPSAPSAPAAGPPSASPTPASGAPGAPGGIAGLPGGSAESAFKQTEANIKNGSGIGGAPSIVDGPISSTQPPAGYRAPEVQSVASQVNALRDVMKAQTGQFSSPFTNDMNKTIRTIAGEVGVDSLGRPGPGAGDVANVMVNRDINNNTPGQPKFDNDLDNIKQWEARKAPSYKVAAPGTEAAKNVANEAIKGLMDGPLAPNAVGFRAINQRNGVKTQTTGIDIGGQRFGNFDGVSEQDMADLRSMRGLPGGVKSINTPPSTEPSTENQMVAAGKGSLAEGMGLMSTPATNPPVSGVDSIIARDWNKVINSPYNTVFPERAPVTGTATSFPGRPRPGANALGVPRVHSGVDIAVEPGAPVKPTVPGKVIQVANSTSAYGPTVQVMNTYGVVDRYALHQDQAIPVKVGDTVTADTVLGNAGPLPGKNKFSHLHYERITPQDPAFSDIKRGIQDGSLAKNRDGVVGNTSTYSRKSPSKTNFNSSTPEWTKSVGLTQGESVKVGQKLAGPAERQLAEVEEAARPAAPKLGIADLPAAPPPAEAPIPRMRPPDSMFALDPRLNVPSAGYPAAAPPSVFAQDPRASIQSSGYPAAPPRNPIGGMSFTPDMPGPITGRAAGTYTSPYDPEVQGPIKSSEGLPSIPEPTGMTLESVNSLVGLDSIISGDPRASMTPGSYPAAPEEEILGEPEVVPEDFAVPQDPALDNPGSIIGTYNGIKGLLSSVDSTLAKGWKTISTPNKDFKRAAETYGPAHGLMGRIGGYDKQWDKEVSEGVKPAVDSLKQTLTRMQDNLRQAMSGPSPEDAQRGADTVQKAEGKKMSDRLPGSDDVTQFSEGTVDGTTTTLSPAEVKSLPSIGYSGFGSPTLPTTDLINKAALVDAGLINEPEPLPSEKVSVLTQDDLGLPYGAPNRNFSYPTGPDGTPLQPDQIDPRDMAKLRARHQGVDPETVLNEDERRAATVGGFVGGVANRGLAKLVTTAIDKLYPGTGMNALNDPEKAIQDYYSRPSWEQDQIKAWADEGYAKKAVGSGGRDVGPYGNSARGVSANGGSTTQTGTTPDDVAGGKQDKYLNWANGIGIPEPGTPEYTEYIWWYNSVGG